MSVTEGELIRFNIDYENTAQRCTDSYDYVYTADQPDETGLTAPERFWEHVKADWRALFATNANVFTYQVRVKSLSLPETGIMGAYAIPTLERTGSRGSVANPMPPFVSAGIRWAVGSAVTRPGQSRISCLTEADVEYDSLQASILTPLAPFCLRMLTSLPSDDVIPVDIADPVVVGYDPPATEPTRFQQKVGYVLNTYSTSQVSRKRGRGV